MSGRYATAAALRAAIEDRLRAEVGRSGRDPNWLRRRLVFVRILARLSAYGSRAWVLKGGMAIELRRPGRARSTRDIDVVLRPGLVVDPSDAEEVREALLDALGDDVDGDRFVFRVGRSERLRDDAYGRPAWRFLLEATPWPVVRLLSSAWTSSPGQKNSRVSRTANSRTSWPSPVSRLGRSR